MQLSSARARDLRSAQEVFANRQEVHARLWSLKKPAVCVPAPEPAPPPPPPMMISPPLPVATEWLDGLIEFNDALRALSGIKDVPAPLSPPPPAEPTRLIIRTIRMVVANHCGVSIDDITGPSRHRPYTRPRFIAMYLSSRMTSASMCLIGRYYGGRDHTTVLNATRRVAEWVTESAEIAAEVASLAEKIRSLRA